MHPSDGPVFSPTLSHGHVPWPRMLAEYTCLTGISLMMRSADRPPSRRPARRGTGVGQHDVDHRHRDLRVFLARRGHQAEDAHRQHGEEQQR